MMTRPHVDASAILELAQAGESDTVEFKLENENQPDIAELLAALANAQGGIVLFGVTDEGEVSGVSNPNRVTARIKAAARSCRPSLEDALEVHSINVAGKNIVVAQLPNLGDAVYSYSGIFRRRNGSANVALSDTALFDLVTRRHGRKFDRQPVFGASLQDLDRVAVNRLLEARASFIATAASLAPAVYPSSEAVKLLQAMSVLTDEHGTMLPTIAGLLMVGSDPQAYLPNAVVQIARFRGSEPVEFLDRAELIGNIPAQIEAALRFVERNTSFAAKIGGAQREDIRQFPPAVVREAIVNAILHRDYLIAAKINVSIFDDRIEVINPGGLLPGLKLDNIVGAHMLRNEKLGPLMLWLRWVESWGTGIRRMTAAMKAADLPEPTFSADESWFQVTLYGHRPQASLPTSSGEQQAIVAEDAWRVFSERQQKLLREFVSEGRQRVTAAEYAAKFGISHNQSLRDLNALVSSGLLQRVGLARQAAYVMRWQHNANTAADGEIG